MTYYLLGSRVVVSIVLVVYALWPAPDDEGETGDANTDGYGLGCDQESDQVIYGRGWLWRAGARLRIRIWPGDTKPLQSVCRIGSPG